ncbi:hypothetical protein [Chryseolinea lacunae]|uniref:Uncharacterized protein n=1 Tax=Chryseolinea lacunae TaxID=2801331 RepID=A0ABS1KKH0_9BACT|nr:hypothetical protein [Chryseolinea lacunae]MBL0739727.1 hypothetical protein [Chryseolinea lacunae]
MNTSLLSTSGFIVVTLVTYAAFFQMLRQSLQAAPLEILQKQKVFRNSLLAVSAWALVSAGLALSGLLADFSSLPPKMFIVLVVPLVVIVAVVRTKTVGILLAHTNASALIKLQGFRIAVEFLLWALFIQNLAPVQMTFEGRNFDIVSGLTALPMAWLVAQKKMSSMGILIWNLLCLGLLINIVAVAVLSMPTPLRHFMNEPANTIVAHFPEVWLPALLVPMAYGLHFLSIRKTRIDAAGK